MNIGLHRTGIALGHRQLIQLVDARGARVDCREGRLWITQDHDNRDVMLGAGDVFTLERDGVTLVQALGGARIEVAERAGQ